MGVGMNGELTLARRCQERRLQMDVRPAEASRGSGAGSDGIYVEPLSRSLNTRRAAVQAYPCGAVLLRLGCLVAGIGVEDDKQGF